MERGDAGGQRREHVNLPIGADAQDRARSIADVERAVGTERETRRHAQLRGVELGAIVGEQPVDVPLEPARDIHGAVGTERERGRVADVGGNRLAHALTIEPIQRNRHLRVAAAAVRDIQPPVAIERGAVDLVDAGRERPRDLDLAPSGSRDPADARPSARPPRSRARWRESAPRMPTPPARRPRRCGRAADRRKEVESVARRWRHRRLVPPRLARWT